LGVFLYMKSVAENHVRLTANWHRQFLPSGQPHFARLS
jgi:hypothetical protein